MRFFLINPEIPISIFIKEEVVKWRVVEVELAS
jgi:hypothetical protein